MGRKVLPGALAIVAAFADARGAHGLAFDLLLAAVPFTAVAALVSFGTYLEDRASSLIGVQSLLWTLALALLVLSCAARSPASSTDTLPPLGWSALVGCLAIFAIKALVAAAPYARRLAYQPAKP